MGTETVDGAEMLFEDRVGDDNHRAAKVNLTDESANQTIQYNKKPHQL